MTKPGATFGRSDVARLLGIEDWQLGILASRRYAYRIRPSARRARGRGKKGLYSVQDVYKIALALQMQALGLEARVIGEILRILSAKWSHAFVQRPKEVNNHRYLEINYSRAPWASRERLLKDWGPESVEDWVKVCTTDQLVWLTVNALMRQAIFVMPFDAILDEVDERILGRKIGPTPALPGFSDKEPVEK